MLLGLLSISNIQYTTYVQGIASMHTIGVQKCRNTNKSKCASLVCISVQADHTKKQARIGFLADDYHNWET